MTIGENNSDKKCSKSVSVKKNEHGQKLSRKVHDTHSLRDDKGSWPVLMLGVLSTHLNLTNITTCMTSDPSALKRPSSLH